MSAETLTLLEKFRTAYETISDPESDDTAADAEYGALMGVLLALIHQIDAARGEGDEQERTRESMRGTLAGMKDTLTRSHDARCERIFAPEGTGSELYGWLTKNLGDSSALVSRITADADPGPMSIAYGSHVGGLRHFLSELRGVTLEKLPKDQHDALLEVRRCLGVTLTMLDDLWRDVWNALLFEGEQVPLRTLFVLGFGQWERGAPPTEEPGRT
jgi:hypothetical protein